MRIFRSCFHRVRSLFRRERLERELRDELAWHLEIHMADNLRAGLSPEEARRVTLLKLGGMEQAKESYRGRRGLPVLESLLQDLRFGLRMLAKNPGFTAVAILTLALGIGANTAVFSIVDAVLLKPLPYQGADRLVAVWSTEIGQPGAKIFAPYRYVEEFKANSHSFEQLATLTWARAGEILTWRGAPHEVLAIPASANFFSLLGIPMAKGRTFYSEFLAHPRFRAVTMGILAGLTSLLSAVWYLWRSGTLGFATHARDRSPFSAGSRAARHPGPDPRTGDEGDPDRGGHRNHGSDGVDPADA
jgi:hypothetical protein